MEKLHLDNNRLIGTIPDDVLSLVRLRELKLSHNRQETQCFEALTECGAQPYQGGVLCCGGDNGEQVCADGLGVEIVDPIYYCLTPGLHGTIPAGFTNTPYLQVLDLSSTLLKGNIPPEIGGLSRLEILDLSNSALTGSIPSSLGALTDAVVLVRGNDMIRGQNK
eukprot:10782996-Ditylum_brightwellii.AAC.1